MLLNKKEIRELMEALMIIKVVKTENIQIDGDVYQKVHFSSDAKNPQLIAKLSIMLEMAQ